MNTGTPSNALASAPDTAATVWPPATRAERDRLRDQAMAQAHALRAQAVDAFWRDTDAWVSDAIGHTRRSADRLAARLRQHAKLRAAAEGSRAIET